ncbi:MAG: bifunctional fructose-bisphosphatase/inositol-phosphate phosphatase [Methanobacterium sp.]|uniref:bifunctional fructose-bisphosphatase/inositol-phosphate phosphatase n=1 Tax=Methanobacterium sp. TaxID=2164 RepID=UPI003D6484DC|nr:bifunctional fructose-bisphosphatase/inositol-phosphate phosphatase [Methanobacterium sp.]
MENKDMEFWRNVSYDIIDEVQKAISPLVGKEKSGEVMKIGADGTPTKLIDEVAEEKVIEVLENTGKTVNLVSEEIGEVKIGNGKPEATFVVDPLDGTANAVKNIPAYAISIAIAPALDLSTINDIKMGFVKNFATGDLYEGFKGKGSHVNGNKLITSSHETIAGSSIGVYIRGAKMDEIGEIFSLVRRIRLLGSIAIELCYVAGGTYDAFLDIRGNLRIIDMAAAKLIIEEAGGTMTDENCKDLNNKLNVKERTSVVASSNSSIHSDIIKFLEVL